MVASLEIVSATEVALPLCEDDGFVSNVDARLCEVLPPENRGAPLFPALSAVDGFDALQRLPRCSPIEDDPEWEDDVDDDDDDDDDEDDDFFPDDEDDDFDDEEEDDFEEFEDEDDDF